MQKYEVFVDDNFHFWGDDEPATGSKFDTMENAVAECQRIVDSSLRGLYEPGMSAHQLFRKHQVLSLEPWIKNGTFSASEYARELSGEICGPTKNGKKAKKRKKSSAISSRLVAREERRS